jgi:hypothetical protein
MRHILIAVLCAASVMAQTTINGSRTVSGDLTVSGKTSTIQIGTPLPATCATTNVYIRTSDNTIHRCSATDTWTQVAAAGTGDVVGPASSTDKALVAFNGTTGKLIRATDAVSGVVKVNGSGVPSVVTGTASDCVKVDGSSGTCGGGSGWTVTASAESATVSATNDFFSPGVAVPGGTFAANRTLKLTWIGTATTDSTTDVAITLYLCTDVNCASSPVNLSGVSASHASTTNSPWIVTNYLTLADDATTLNVHNVGTFLAGSAAQRQNRPTSTPTINPATDYWFKIRQTGASWSGDSATLNTLLIEWTP